jgi:outer membrane protein assembly factor BamB
LIGTRVHLADRWRAGWGWAATVVVLAASAVLAGATPTRAGVPLALSPAWVPDGAVNGLLAVGGTVFVAGQFSRLSPPQGSFAVFRGGSDSPDGSVVQLRDGGAVSAIVADGNGGWFVGGSFESFAGSRCPNLVHVLASGSVERRWCPRPDGGVGTLARTGRKLYVAGGFSQVAGAGRTGLAALDTRSGRALPFRVRLGASPAIHPVQVFAMVAGAKTVFLAGVFASVDGHVARRLAAVSARSGRLQWSAQPDGRADALALARGRLFVGGFFEHVNGEPRPAVAALDPRSGHLLNWQPQKLPHLAVYTLAASPSAVYIGGPAGVGLTRRSVLAVSPETGRILWEGRYAGSDGPSAIALSGRRVIVAGSDIRALSKAAGRPLRWHVRTDRDVAAVAVSGSRLAAGGTFQSVAPGVSRESLGGVNGSSGRPTSWTAIRDSRSDFLRLEALAAVGDTLYVGGEFERIDGHPRNGLAALDLRTGALEPWTTPVQFGWCSDGYAGCALAAGNGALYLAVGGTVVAVDASTGATLPWNPAPNLGVISLAVSGSTVYLGGDFTRIKGGGHPYLAAVDATSGAPLTWRPRLDGPVTAVALQATTLYVGGRFTHVGSAARDHLAAFDTTTGALLPWNPRPTSGAGTNMATQTYFPITTIVPAGPTIYIAGVFEHIGGADRHNLAALDATTGNAKPWAPAVASTVSTIAATPGLIYLGGSFGLLAVPPPQ